ncbi:hypothetical protein LVD15_11205 [Fulvivirga maritima]|uniref:hypothetical protein n=1 Tax=Fulvivirga maritima TaxID=2904247 RepID=UPI001F20463B|nr:hypothetical protein [Fulvivirga maritima]UII28964.1 hypothetical protein LVD15_11205 [Fulvivirga maritima]
MSVRSPKTKKEYSALTVNIIPKSTRLKLSEQVNEGTLIKFSKPLVKKIEGPFDERGEKVNDTKKGNIYIFKATEFQKSTLSPIKNIWWAHQIDDGDIKDIELTEENLYLDKYDNVCLKYKLETSKPTRIYAYCSKPIKNVSVLLNEIIKETIIVVGTEQHSSNSANKLMFPAQAVREIRERFKNSPNLEVLIFKDGYTANQLTAFSNSVLFYNKKARVTQINNVDELINFTNGGSRKKNAESKYREIHKISEMIIFAHGYVRDETNEGVIAFGLDGPNENIQELDSKAFKKIDSEVFLANNESHLYSYACRTGIGVSSEIVNNPLKSNSLAQKMSDHGKINVHAYLKRSLYEDTWGTQNHRDTYISDNDQGASFMENFKSDIKDAFLSDPNDMEAFVKYISSEKKIDGAIWNPKGAYLPVKAGDFPKGVSSKYEVYKPK